MSNRDICDKCGQFWTYHVGQECPQPRPREFEVNPDHNICVEKGGYAKKGLGITAEYIPLIHVIEYSAVEALRTEVRTLKQKLSATYRLKLEEENQRLREALEFYADPKNFYVGMDDEEAFEYDNGEHPFGQKARAALERLQGAGE